LSGRRAARRAKRVPLRPVASTDQGEPVRSFTDLLRSEIVSGVFSPNERLVEADLADRYHVSRGTARAALAELAKEGLVERSPNRGARVRALSPEEATEISETRFAIEGLCAAEAARHATSDQVTELHSVVSAMKKAVDAQDIIRYYELVARLGERIRAVSRHRTAAAMSKHLLNQLAPYSTIESFAPGRINASLAEYRAIVDAIARADPEAAEAAMRKHRLGVAAARRDVAGRLPPSQGLPFRPLSNAAPLAAAGDPASSSLSEV
jgi:DNA-binding GntR family transcriptional regulator